MTGPIVLDNELRRTEGGTLPDETSTTTATATTTTTTNAASPTSALTSVQQPVASTGRRESQRLVRLQQVKQQQQQTEEEQKQEQQSICGSLHLKPNDGRVERTTLLHHGVNSRKGYPADSSAIASTPDVGSVVSKAKRAAQSLWLIIHAKVGCVVVFLNGWV